MKVLTAPHEQDPRDEGFTHTIPGELLIRGPVCDEGREGTCGCERSWTGMVSRQATTLALVAENAMPRDTFLGLVTDHLAEQGWPRADAYNEGLFLAGLADGFPAGVHVTIEPTTDQASHEIAELEM